MSKRTIGIIIFVAFLTLLFVWKIPGKNTLPFSSSEKMHVTASFYPLAFLASEIGGDKVQVLNVTPAGAEPHEYEPTSRDIAEMEQSKILIINGLGLEPWYENVKANINPKKTTLLVAGEELGDTATKDPHVWLSPLRMKTMAERIEQSFVKADPKNEDYYIGKLQSIKTKLDALDADYKKGLANCQMTSIITSHAAFGYLVSDYGLRQVSIAGLSPDAEPSPKALVNITTFAKAYGVKYIFFESLVSPKLAQTIADEVGAKTLVLNPLEGLTQKEQADGKNYISIMRENLSNLQTALSCTK